MLKRKHLLRNTENEEEGKCKQRKISTLDKEEDKKKMWLSYFHYCGNNIIWRLAFIDSGILINNLFGKIELPILQKLLIAFYVEDDQCITPEYIEEDKFLKAAMENYKVNIWPNYEKIIMNLSDALDTYIIQGEMSTIEKLYYYTISKDNIFCEKCGNHFGDTKGRPGKEVDYTMLLLYYRGNDIYLCFPCRKIINDLIPLIDSVMINKIKEVGYKCISPWNWISQNIAENILKLWLPSAEAYKRFPKGYKIRTRYDTFLLYDLQRIQKFKIRINEDLFEEFRYKQL
jgi:hypothetical protein